MTWLLLLACSRSPEPDPVAAALAPLPDDPAALQERCRQEPFPELATTCWVRAAAKLGEAGDAAAAARVCDALEPGTWQDECRFRAGEELGAAGRVPEGLGLCMKAGRFARNCITHTIWRAPAPGGLTSAADPALIEATWAEQGPALARALAGAEATLAQASAEEALAAFGHHLYVGSGAADPDPARLDGPLGAALRSGFAIEAVRLLIVAGEKPTVGAVLARWKGEQPALAGAPLAEEHRKGRFHSPILSPHEDQMPSVATFASGRRLVGATPEEDLVVAALEALYWRPGTPADAFRPWVDDPRPAVRLTAAKLLRLTKGRDIDVEAELKRIAAEHADPAVRWHAEDGLKRRTFEGPTAGPPPRGQPLRQPGKGSKQKAPPPG